MTNFRLLHHGVDNSRICKIESNGKNTTTPIYFASITTAAKRTGLGQLIDTIFGLPYPNMLFSSYDIYYEYENNSRKEICDILNQYSAKGSFLFIDSGYFEMIQLKNSDWKFELYEETLKDLECDFFASFDVATTSEKELDELLKSTKEGVEKSCSLSKNNQCIAIIHGSDKLQMCNLIEGLNSINKPISFFAVVERELGKNIIEDYKTVKEIRKTLDKTNPNSLLHILGCGDPLSIATLVYAGADSFDSVDWNRWLINPTTLEYENLHHINIIDCSCDACIDDALDFREKAYRHNLLFYRKFFYELQFAIGNNKDLITFLKECHINEKKLTKLSKYF